MTPPSLRLKREIEDSLRARENRNPRRFTGFSFMDVFAQGGIPMREVPQVHWVRGEVDELTVVHINCPCGQNNAVAIGEYPAKCPGPDCPRSFFFDGTAVWALLSPTS